MTAASSREVAADPAATDAAAAADADDNEMPRPTPVNRSWLRDLLSSHVQSLDPTCPSRADPLLRHKALVVAPMVDQSDLPFRLLCRRYGANLCYTPMFHARMFCDRKVYREKFWNFVNGTPPEDRPLVAQFCGGDADTLLAAMKMVQHGVDAVDINCGCPQGIARRGRYGAFLLENPKLPDIVRYLVSNLSVPVTVKVRILPTGVDDSLDLYEKLVDAGASLITVHGRNRHQKKDLTGAADWDAIRRTVERVGHRVPVLANGGIGSLDDVRECIRQTGVDGVMSSEAILEYPALFLETNTEATGGKRTGPGRVRLAREFLDLCRRYPPDEGGQGSGMKCVRAHLHKMLMADLDVKTDLRDLVAFQGKTMEVMYDVVTKLERAHVESGHRVEDEELSWYVRHRIKSESDKVAAMELEKERNSKEEAAAEEESEDDDSAMFVNLFGDGEVCGYGEEEGDY